MWVRKRWYHHDSIHRVDAKFFPVSSQLLFNFCSTFVQLLFNFFPVPSRLRQLLRSKQIIYLPVCGACSHSSRHLVTIKYAGSRCQVFPSFLSHFDQVILATLAQRFLSRHLVTIKYTGSRLPSFSQFLITFWSSSSCHPSPTLSKQTLGHNKIHREQMPFFPSFLSHFDQVLLATLAQHFLSRHLVTIKYTGSRGRIHQIRCVAIA